MGSAFPGRGCGGRSPAMLRSCINCAGDVAIVYQLLIRLKIGRLGMVFLPGGYYIYSGSVKRAATARLERHLRKCKCKRWHIDYLLCRAEARVMAVRLWRWRQGRECAVNRRLLRARLAEPIVKGFGSSDCASGCAAHLLKVAGRVQDLMKV